MLSGASALENGDEDRSGQAQALADAFSRVPQLTWSHGRMHGQLWRLGHLKYMGYSILF